MTYIFYWLSFLLLGLAGVISWFWPPFAWTFLVLGPVFLLGVIDSLQRRMAVRRNFPVIGNLRYLMEMIRPEISQYFIESNTDGMPFSRELRSIVYQRAKQELSSLPFGTQRDLYAVGVEWINHSLQAEHFTGVAPRVSVGGARCEQPYDAALLNISAMSFGSLSAPAIRALNAGAAMGGFYHNTGEGSISPHHLAGGGDLVWQIGTGYFGCRSADGGFNAAAFQERASLDVVKMIELKLSQGAKPGHGGILPAVKITPEIAEMRGVPMGSDVISPPAHTAFRGPHGLLEFLERLRELSGGKPVGFKLCVGNPTEFLSICRSMHESRLLPDFISVDGAEGGTGAAPLEFSNSMGFPLTEGLTFVHNALIGFDLRQHIKLIASGKIITGFDMAKRLAQGADLCNSARGMMFSLGCIQARRCHSNDCPVGVATQDRHLTRGLVVSEKVSRVANFQTGTVTAFMELLGAAGLEHPDELEPRHILRRISGSEVKSYAEIYDYLQPGELLGGEEPVFWTRFLRSTSADSFVTR
jgi:glutamate synthase domain-containing protein 2